MRLVLRKFQLSIDDATWLDEEAIRVQRPVASILRDAVKALRLGRTPKADRLASAYDDRSPTEDA